MSKLPVTVISPVLNCISAMPDHVEHLRRLSALVEEIIVIDSYSEDGTKDFLLAELSGLNVRFLDHPRGLYASWNYAISAATQTYLNIATVGDVLSVSSLQSLHEAMTKFSADVVVSPPTFILPVGTPAKRRWPIHRLLNVLEPRPTSAFALQPMEWLAANFAYFSANLISSSASNLYRTALLKKHPFPVNYSHWGDCAWSMMVAAHAKWVIHPSVSSTMLLHPHSVERKESQIGADSSVRADLGKSVLEQNRKLLEANGFPPHLIGLFEEIVELNREKHKLKLDYKTRPLVSIPWFLNPFAVGLRGNRKRVESRLKEKQHQVLEYLNNRWDGSSFSN